MIRSRSLLLVPLVLGLAGPQTGCIGSFALTDKVFQWNRGLGSIIVQEIVFLVMVIIPVYGFTVFADAIVLNLIEFITGSNPLAGADREPREIALAEGVTLSLEERGGVVSATLTGATAEPVVRLYSVNGSGAVVRDQSGTLLFSAELDGTGGVVVSGADGSMFADYSPADVAAAHKAFLVGGGSALAVAARPEVISAVAAE